MDVCKSLRFVRAKGLRKHFGTSAQLGDGNGAATYITIDENTIDAKLL